MRTRPAWATGEMALLLSGFPAPCIRGSLHTGHRLAGQASVTQVPASGSLPASKHCLWNAASARLWARGNRAALWSVACCIGSYRAGRLRSRANEPLARVTQE